LPQGIPVSSYEESPIPIARLHGLHQRMYRTGSLHLNRSNHTWIPPWRSRTFPAGWITARNFEFKTCPNAGAIQRMKTVQKFEMKDLQSESAGAVQSLPTTLLKIAGSSIGYLRQNAKIQSIRQFKIVEHGVKKRSYTVSVQT
jgi:hypothetical protein